MNKKIFTLFAGALLLLGSSFTASAQLSSPYELKYGFTTPTTTAVPTAFRDSLSIDTCKKYVDESHYYIISVTGVANPTTPAAMALNANSTINSQVVLFVDGDGATKGFLRADTIGALDYEYKYAFKYGESTKFGAIRRASWCVSNEAGGVAGSNRVWDFANMETGKSLETPLFDSNDAEGAKSWSEIDNGHIYKSRTLDMFGDDNIVSGWHFSQTFSSQNLQTSMPLYSYVGTDSVVVLVVDTASYITPAGQVGGWPVTVKQVSINDLITGSTGAVNVTTAKKVSNVLLFTLKQINPFVLNAIDFNAVSNTLTFDPDAHMTTAGVDGWNPFTLGQDGAGNNGKGWLTGEEVSDSLYHYGYMYMKNANGYLYVDTAFWNIGNSHSLKFNWTSYKRDTLVDGTNGESQTVTKLGYWGAAFNTANPYTSTAFIGTWNKNFPDSVAAGWQSTANGAGAHWYDPSTSSLVDSAAYYADTVLFRADSVYYYDVFRKDSLMARYKDSIMENQSKFRVVYDPWENNTKINVYQTRFQNPDYTNQSTTGVEYPYWWENSFDLNGNVPHLSITSNAYNTYMQNMIVSINSGDRVEAEGLLHHWSDGNSASGAYHGGSGYGDWNSFLKAYVGSSPSNMDKIMISTADTVSIYYERVPFGIENAFAHSYTYSLTKDKRPYYQDSLFYVTVQDLDGKNNKLIATIAQNGPNKPEDLLPKISLNYGVECVPDDSKEKASINNNLYLIRNSLGQYLCVPIWSAMDSIYWANPENGEDPSRMPCYQWAVENIRSAEGSPFKLTNREFERVSIPYVYVYANKDTAFDMAGKYAPKFNTRIVYPNSSDSISFRMKVANKTMSYDTYDDGIDFVGAAEKVIPLSSKTSFLPLDQTVKGDQLLGYKYIDKDSTLVDVYALRYKHFMTSNSKPRYVGWNGYKTTEDTTLYVNYDGELDRLFFDLQEMPFEDIDTVGTRLPGDSHLAIEANDPDYGSIYEKYGQKSNNYQNSDSLVMEGFGYMPTKKVSGKLQYDYSKIPGLRPLARQAYRFLLKDYYKFSPTINGDFWTVGENDNYILADKIHATKKYNGYDKTGNFAGVFGIPYFYFRNTFFDYHENDTNEDHDYFALVQRLDTVNFTDNSGSDKPLKDVLEYLTYRFGSNAANRVKEEIEISHELGVFIAVVEDYTATLKLAVRGDAAIRVSTFRLHQDNDPLYRRFHGNDSWAEDGWGDKPDTLEFHKLNKGDLPEALYENSGTYLSFGKEGDNHDYGANGGRIYNFADKNNTTLLKDSLGNVISFLGINNMDQYPGIQDGGTTNYSLFVDTAYINRGTGWIKPQYMLAVDPYTPTECGKCQVSASGSASVVTPNTPYVIARYLFNTSMYAKQISDSVIDKETYEWVHQAKNFNMVKRVNTGVNAYSSIVTAKDGKNYCNDNWERLAFAWAIHKGDSLYVLKGVEPAFGGSADGDPEALFKKLSSDYGDPGNYIDFEKLVNDNIVAGGDYVDDYYPGNNDMSSVPLTYHTYKNFSQLGGKIGLQAIINLADNTHKDWVFSMRYFERGSDDFIIESETTDRDTKTGAVIRPGYGGWVKYQNGVPTITRSDEKELLGEGTFFNVEKPKYDNGKTVDPVSNEAIANGVKVIAGTGNVTILNATGKKVVISNILGQTVANTVLSSDNASVAAPAGVVIVAVEGETAVKAIVK